MKQTYKGYYKDYYQTKCKRVSVVLNKEKDADIIEALEDGKNIQATAKGLIRAGIESKKK